MENLTFTKNGKYFVSESLTDGSNYTVRLSLPKNKKCTIVVESTILGTDKPWTSQHNYTVYGGEWEKNINGIAPGQKIRISSSVNPDAAYYQEY